MNEMTLVITCATTVQIQFSPPSRTSILVKPPEYEDRIAVLKVTTRSMAADPNIDLGELTMMLSDTDG